MGWNTRWEMRFTSLHGTQYTVYIKEQEAGSVTQLTPAEEPFTTQEDDDDDIFTPIRVQTGYLRVIDTTGDLLSRLVPENNTEKYVVVQDDEYNICWKGFIQAQAYTQPWLDGTVEIELPVKSLIGALEDVMMDGEEYRRIEISELFLAPFRILDVMPARWHVIGDLQPNTYFWPLYVNTSVFLKDVEVCNEGTTEMVTEGESYADAISKVLSLYGLQMRQHGNEIYLAQYDNVYDYSLQSYNHWEYIYDNELTYQERTQISIADLIASTDFRGDDAEVSFLQGAKSCVVKLDVNSGNITVLQLPKTDEDASATVNVPAATAGDVIVQPHPMRTGSGETFTYRKYDLEVNFSTQYNIDIFAYSDQGASNYSECRRYSAFGSIEAGGNPRFSPAWTSGGQSIAKFYGIYTGAIPIRWAQQSEGNTPTLQNGLWLVLQCGGRDAYSNTFINDPVYRIQADNIEVVGKYLVIDFDDYAFENLNTDGTTAFFNDIGSHMMRFRLQWGGYYWNGSAWVTDSSVFFDIQLDHSNIQSNKGDYSDIDVSGGWVIPVPTTITTGTLWLEILAPTTAPCNPYYETAMNHIITGLKVEQVLSAALTASSRGDNTYRRLISATGFIEERSIDLDIGTMNNNNPSYNFIERETSGVYSYIESFIYFNNRSFSMRPERYLLARMWHHYSQTRRTLTAVAQSSLNTQTCLYTYQGKTFFGVQSQVNWRDDTTEIKFIEVEKIYR